jgi:hypothetical protein
VRVTTPTGPTRRLSRFLALAIVVVTGAVAWLAVDTARGVVSRRGERHGTVTVSRCSLFNFGRHADTYSCVGAFTSDDGDLRLPVVSFLHTGALDAGELVAGTVSGPGDDTASIDSEFALRWRLVFAAAGVAGLVALLVKRRRLRPGRP